MFKFLKKFILKRIFKNRYKYVDEKNALECFNLNLNLFQLDIFDKSLFSFKGMNNKILSPYDTCESYSREIANITNTIKNGKFVSDVLLNKHNKIIRLNFYLVNENGNQSDSFASINDFKLKCEDLNTVLKEKSNSTSDQDRVNLFRIQYFIQQLNEHLESLIILSIRE